MLTSKRRNELNKLDMEIPFVIDRVIHTCSMKELGEVDDYILLYKIRNKEEVKYLLNNPVRKAFILNTNVITKRFMDHMKKLGFKKVFQYTGHHGRVDTWMIKF